MGRIALIFLVRLTIIGAKKDSIPPQISGTWEIGPLLGAIRLDMLRIHPVGASPLELEAFNDAITDVQLQISEVRPFCALM